MSFYSEREDAHDHGGSGVRPSAQTFRPQNLRVLQPQQVPTSYQYEQPTAQPATFSSLPSASYVPQRPGYVPFPPPVPPATQSSVSPYPLRPPFPNHSVRHNFATPPYFPPAPPAVHNTSNTAAAPAPVPATAPPPPPPSSGQNPFPYGVPPSILPPPVMPQQVSYQSVYATTYSQQAFPAFPPPPPAPPPSFSSYQHSSYYFQSNSHYRHTTGQYSIEAAPNERRSPERNRRYDDQRRRAYNHGHGERHRSESHGDWRDQGRGPDRRRQESSRHRPDHDHSRTPSRHRTYDRSRERHRHRERRRSPSPERSYKKEYKGGDSTVVGTSKLRDLYDRFEEELGKRQTRAKAARPPWEPPKTKLDEDPESFSESESDTDDDSSCSSCSDSEVFDVIGEIKRKKAHPDRLHEELWYNDPGQMNDGPLCKCSFKARRTGIRHSIYPGEEPILLCRPMTNNAGRLFHYRITVAPPTNFLTDRPTVIEYDDHEYIFEGFSMFSHAPLTNIPLCKVIRFNIDYTIHFIEEMMPQNFCMRGLELFSSYLFKDILELYDWDLIGPFFDESSSCQRFHFMPRFVRFLPDGGKEVLSMHQVLLYLLRCSKALVPEEELGNMLQWEELEWQKYAEECKGMIVTNPGMKPSSVRIDHLDREQPSPDVITFPVIVHFGIRPAQLSYAGDPQYQKLWKSYVKLRHLLANSPKVKLSDRLKLGQREEALQKIRQKNTMRREVTVELSSQGFWKTGIRSDVCQHAMMLPVLTHHIRYHQCLMHLDILIGYTFQDRALLQLAMTHPSHHLNFGMNPDHARNSLSNCGIRQPKYGDRKVHHMHMRKKGINTLINIMSRLGQDDPTPSRINHNERLEFLGDAVVEFLTSVHLYYLFPGLEEGGLATYRTAIVQNQHLAMLAKKLELDRFMLYAHGPDLCRESDLRHAMANCFEALIGAVYLEGSLEEAKQLFGRLLFNSQDLREVWLHYPLHPLQQQESNTDRQLIATSPVLQKLTVFEDAIGVSFTHIRLLARAFTLRTVGFNHLTLGHNQRMEFLGDSIMQLVATQYLFIHFPDHHEGHLTLLRSSLVNNRTQAKVAEELGMHEFAITNDKTKRHVSLRTKTLADLLESFIAALYIDKDLEYVHTFMNVCFFPRLKEFILNQDWNDPKSQLQQCCLTLRSEGKEPDIPLYKTLQTLGPSHARTYTVAVYFKGERIGCGKGPSIQQAEMGAAVDALEKYNFPQMAHQKRFIERKYRQELKEMKWEREHHERGSDEAEDDMK
ncbi:ribonuclease 3 [Microcaecilia unicolor]|uniref:Ribonuclease 3 n=1 Tax=Microcaecilia unicolor TaxID=1415580 RepID=A0A6P7ZA95_9AMPH|nr:ribonuclease 3 [Microcaecilia unicolor]